MIKGRRRRGSILKIDRLYSNEVRLLLGSQKGALQQASSSLAPHGASRLFESLAHLLEALEHYFEEYLTSIKNSPDNELESKTAAIIFSRYVGFIHNQYVRFLVPSDPYSFPGEVLHPLKDILIKFGGYEAAKTSLGLFHWDKYNFGIIKLSNPLDLVTREIEKSLSIERPKRVEEQVKELVDTLIFICYPQAEGRNVFLHGLLFHELGHVIDSKKMISDPILKIIKNWTGTNPNAPSILTSWVKEIVADLIAIRIVGPCVLFASRMAALTMEVMDNDSPSHPSSRFRALWMLEHLERIGYVGSRSDLNSIHTIRDWHKKLTSARLSPAKEYEPFWNALRSDRAVIKAIHENVEQSIGYAFTAADFGCKISDVLAYFNNNLPHIPNSAESIAHLASVLNAVWEKRLTDLAHEQSEDELFRWQEIICGLGLKSIEGNYIQNIWNLNEKDSSS